MQASVTNQTFPSVGSAGPSTQSPGLSLAPQASSHGWTSPVLPGSSAVHLLQPPSQSFLVPWLSQLIAPRNASLLCPVLFQLSFGPSPQAQALVLLPLPPHTYQTAQPPFTPSSREPISTESLPKLNFLVTKILHDQIRPRIWCLSCLPPFCTSCSKCILISQSPFYTLLPGFLQTLQQAGSPVRLIVT